MKNFLIVGLIFGFSGFLLETIESSISQRRFVYAGDKLFWRIPFLPIYAIGGLLMHYIIFSLQNSAWYWSIFIAWLSVCGWEYFSGFFCYRVLGQRFWNYNHHKYNLNGYVCALNSFYWLVLVLLYYFFVFHKINTFLQNGLLLP